MPYKTLAFDLVDYAKAKGIRLTMTQARGLAVLNANSVHTTQYTANYWNRLDKIIRRYLAHQSATDKALGTFAA